MEAMPSKKYVNLSSKELIECSLARKECQLAASGAVVVYTGKRTGRSPKDRFIVRDEITNSQVDWNAPQNLPIEASVFDALWTRVLSYLEDKEQFISELSVGADSRYALSVTVITELAWQNLFVRNLFIRDRFLKDIAKSWTLVSAPNFLAEPARDKTQSEAAIILNFSERKILICGTHYAGEMKKAMFSVLNFILPSLDVLPMHCSANVGKSGDVSLFFGLSGTGKTTLSADIDRDLIGDDEHGWSQEGEIGRASCRERV